jgi:2-haloacid dehalogenase
MIKAAVFDVGHVLIDWDIRYLYEKLIHDPDRLDWFLTNVVTRQWHFQHDAGRPVRETMAELCARFPAEAALIRQYDPRWLETLGRPVSGVAALVERLHHAEVPLFAITNFSGEFWPRFADHYPLVRRFRDVVVSGDEKLMKPDPAIYQLALRRFGLAPGDALFIDDRIENVEAAETNGFAGHHFTGAAKLEATLMRAGLLAAKTH